MLAGMPVLLLQIMETQQELISLANQIPFGDRSNQYASKDEIAMVLIQII